MKAYPSGKFARTYKNLRQSGLTPDRAIVVAVRLCKGYKLTKFKE